MPDKWRVRVVDTLGNTSYLVGTDKDVNYISAQERPLALSNLVDAAAAELRFTLRDIKFGIDAASAVRKVLTEQWKNNPGQCPKVTLIP